MVDSPLDLRKLQPLLELIRLLRDARNRADERAKVTHERFNVFTTLLSAHDEVRLHTRFIHNLLNPRGSHDCGSLFLDLFFATLNEAPGQDDEGKPLMWDPLPTRTAWVVRKEASVEDGQIDLLLESASCGIAIENKIYAGEQDEQLTRYANYLSRRHGQDWRLIFLTLDGRPSVTHGTAHYLRISYAQHILPWLEKCLRETYRFIPINQVLLQYRELVRQLTGKTLDSDLMKDVTDFIVQNPDIIRYRQQIDEGIAGAREVFLNRLAEGITTGMGDGFEVRPRPNLELTRFGNHPNGALIITPPPGNPLHGRSFEIWVEHIAKWTAFVVGIVSKTGMEAPTAEQKLHLELMNLLLADHAKIDYHKADSQTLWDATEWPTGWHNLIEHPIDDERLAQLLTTPIEQTVKHVCDAIRYHIELLTDLYEKANSESPMDGETGVTP